MSTSMDNPIDCLGLLMPMQFEDSCTIFKLRGQLRLYEKIIDVLEFVKMLKTDPECAEDKTAYGMTLNQIENAINHLLAKKKSIEEAITPNSPIAEVSHAPKPDISVQRECVVEVQSNIYGINMDIGRNEPQKKSGEVKCLKCGYITCSGTGNTNAVCVTCFPSQASKGHYGL